jgi:parvulin-like peptidyl-prolyl isomerase
MKPAVLTGIILILTALIIGCGGDTDDKTLAVVGDYEITLKEFRDFFPEQQYRFASAEEEFETKRNALDSLIATRLLVQAAYEKGIDESEELARVVLGTKDRFLLDVLYKHEIMDPAEPTEAELRDFYNHLDTKIRVSQIIVGDADTAQMIFQKLKDGEPFDKMAYEYSIVPSAKKDKGDLGWVTWGDMVDAAQQVAFQMEPGELAPPVESFLGWHIIKVTGKQPNDPGGEFEEVKENLRQRLRGINQYRHRREFIKSLQNNYPFTVDTATVDYLMHKRESMYPPQVLASLPKSDFDLEQLDRNEKELVLATWEGGQVTVMQYLTQIKQIPRQMRPALDNYDSLATMIFTLKGNDIMAHLARKKGLESDPEYQRKLRLFRELNMADLMKNDSLPDVPDPTEEQIRQYYDEHPDEFTTPAKVHIFEILVADELKAQQLKKQIRTKNQFKDKAMELTLRPGRRSVSGDLDYISRSMYPEIFDAAWETPEGSIGGPVMDRGKYSIFWVEDKIQPQLKDFLGVKRDIFKTLQQKRQREMFSQWIEERKESTTVKVNEDAIWSTIDEDAYASSDTAATEG